MRPEAENEGAALDLEAIEARAKVAARLVDVRDSPAVTMCADDAYAIRDVAAVDVPALLARLRFVTAKVNHLQGRERSIIDACERVADGGQYRADTVIAIQRIRKERDAARAMLAPVQEAARRLPPEARDGRVTLHACAVIVAALATIADD